MRIILFGAMGSGKDTIGDYLADQRDFNKESFAKPLKQMVAIAFPDFTSDDLYGPSSNRSREYPQYPMGDRCLVCNRFLHLEGSELVCWNRRCKARYPQHVSPRIALQTIGTEWGRRLSPNIWIDSAFYRMGIHPDDDYAITDGRFVNEHKRCVELGGFTVLLLRKLEEAAKSTHPSEYELTQIPRDKFHYVIDNRGPLEDLFPLVDRMLESAISK